MHDWMVTAAAHVTESDQDAHMTRIDNTYRSVSYSHSSLLAIIYTCRCLVLKWSRSMTTTMSSCFKCTLQLQTCLLSFQARFRQPTKLGSKLVDHDILERLSYFTALHDWCGAAGRGHHSWRSILYKTTPFVRYRRLILETLVRNLEFRGVCYSGVASTLLR